MQKYHNVISLVISVAFIVIIQLFASPQPTFRYLVPAFFLYVAVVGSYNYWYLQSLNKFSVWVWMRFPLLLGGWFTLFLLAPSSVLRGMFLVIGLVLLYFFESFVDSFGEQLLFNQVLLTAFTFFISLFAFNWYFQFASFYFLLATFGLVTILTRSSFAATPVPVPLQWVGSVALGLFTAEVYWSLSFLPFHYSALGLILFAVFYCAWSLYYYFLFNHITMKKIQFHLSLSSVFIILILILTRWSIIK
jgi:hypothetical protein